jgi:ATPase family AAA domain-containing protein 3A/B
MSWLFGIKTQPPPEIPPASTGGDQPNAGQNDRQGGNARASPDGSKFNYSFDSTALERAAKAAKELERSPNAKQALELSRMQELTKQRELELHQKVNSVF